MMSPQMGEPSTVQPSLGRVPLSSRPLAEGTGVATPEENQAFVAKQLRASEEGTFFAGYNFYAMIAERPLE